MIGLIEGSIKGLAKLVTVVLLLTTLVVCSRAEVETAANGPQEEASAAASSTDTSRWYTQDQKNYGQIVFSRNCSQCHGEQAQGLAEDWRVRLEDGSFPPPPLNGTAHAWHHPREVLLKVINEGGIPLGGNMPAFSNVISDSEKLAAIAFFQSFWDDSIYSQWEQMGGTN